MVAATGTIFVCVMILFAMPAVAQLPTDSAWPSGESQHHRMIYQMMKDMTGQMGQMTDQMSRAEPSPGQRRQMVDQMGLMSRIMRRLSGFEARPAIKHADLQKQIDEMRRQMDQMMRGSMAPGVR
jgi:hypothetical protein